jgi:hypothetical protein
MVSGAMGRRRLTTAGKLLIGAWLVAVPAGFLAPAPWSSVTALVAGLILLGVVMGSFMGGTVGGYYRRTPSSERERVERMRGMYGAGRRQR